MTFKFTISGEPAHGFLDSLESRRFSDVLNDPQCGEAMDAVLRHLSHPGLINGMIVAAQLGIPCLKPLALVIERDESLTKPCLDKKRLRMWIGLAVRHVVINYGLIPTARKATVGSKIFKAGQLFDVGTGVEPAWSDQNVVTLLIPLGNSEGDGIDYKQSNHSSAAT
jgi:hypothetical protein